MINFLNEFENIVTKSENEYVYVGMDTEWKPSCVIGMNTDDSNKVALIQIATLEQIYLIDMINLNNLNESDSKLFAEKFLYNKKIIKLGYGFTHDIKMILKSFINLHDADLLRQSVLDLAYFVQQVK